MSTIEVSDPGPKQHHSLPQPQYESSHKFSRVTRLTMLASAEPLSGAATGETMSQRRWKAKSKANDIAFHQSDSNPYLPQFWPTLALVPGSSVVVTLCGNSHDLT